MAEQCGATSWPPALPVRVHDALRPAHEPPANQLLRIDRPSIHGRPYWTQLDESGVSAYDHQKARSTVNSVFGDGRSNSRRQTARSLESPATPAEMVLATCRLARMTGKRFEHLE
jgi:hypothetical protein